MLGDPASPTLVPMIGKIAPNGVDSKSVAIQCPVLSDVILFLY